MILYSEAPPHSLRVAGRDKLPKALDAMQDPDEMQVLLRNAREELEEVELMTRLRGEGADPAIRRDLETRRAKLGERIGALSSFLAAMETEEAEAVDLEAAAREAEEAEARKKREGGCGELTKTAVTILKNTISGVLTIYLYFMDLISDYQVTSTPHAHAPCPLTRSPCPLIA